MEEQKKKQEHKGLIRERRIEKGSLKEEQTLKWKLNKERLQRKESRRGKCEISDQNTRGKTEKCLHVKRILTVHVALNWSNIKLSKMHSTQNTKCQTNMFLSRPTNEDSNKGVTDES